MQYLFQKTDVLANDLQVQYRKDKHRIFTESKR